MQERETQKENCFVGPHLTLMLLTYCIFFLCLRKGIMTSHALAVFMLIVFASVQSAAAVSSILTHCRLEQAAFCFNRDDPVQCLMSNRAEMIDGSTCKTWLGARNECFASVARSSVCSPSETKLQCLVRMPLDEIAVACSESDFFNSVKQDAALFTRYAHYG